MAWNPEQYLKFAGERLRPAVDLLARVELDAPSAVYDLGCGAGATARMLRARWPESAVVGVDASPEMLGQATRESDGVKISWVQADIAEWAPNQPADLIFSNAALHWLDDHDHLFPRLLEYLVPGGWLATQVPANAGAPSHACIAKVIAAGSWRRNLEHLHRPKPVADAAVYFDLLSPMASHVDIWQTEYLHILDGADPVVEWTKGTVLKPLLDALNRAEQDAFLAEYANCVARAYPRRADGRTLFPFRRLFIVARRR
ncbi:MAG: methyltransferase domain-containing protein [Pseudomonadota bacterium]